MVQVFTGMSSDQMHPSLEIHLYICISSICANNVGGLTLINILILTLCHMDLVLHCILSTADSSHNSKKISWAVTGYKFRLSNKSLSMLESFKVVNLMTKLCAAFLKGVVPIDHLSRQCSYVGINTTSWAHKILSCCMKRKLVMYTKAYKQ